MVKACEVVSMKSSGVGREGDGSREKGRGEKNPLQQRRKSSIGNKRNPSLLPCSRAW